MKITGAEVNWNNQWGNDVSLYVLVDKFKSPDYRYNKKKGNLYFAYDAKTGLVSYYAYDSKDRRGFSGSVFKLKMLDGATKSLTGPWSSRSEVMNEAGFISNTEITIQEPNSCGMSSAMANDRIEKVLKKFLPEIKYYIDFESKTIKIPKRQIANKELSKKKKKSNTDSSSLSNTQQEIVRG